MRGTIAWWNLVSLVTIAALLGANGPRLLRERLQLPPASTTHTGAAWNAEGLRTFESSLRRELPGHRRALEMRLEPERLAIELQDPAAPRNVDAYEVRGGVLGPGRPVQILGAEHLEENLFDWDSVVLDAVPFLVRTARDRSQLDEAEVTLVTIRRDPADHGQVKIRVSVNGSRGMAVLEADAFGNVLALRVL